MKILLWIVGGIAALLLVVAVQIGTMTYLGVLDQPEDGALIIDAKTVVRVFIETRGVNLDDDQMAKAIREFDRLVLEEADRIYRTTGRAIINANHVLAGGHDISEEFAGHVIARWDSERGVALQ